MDSVVALDHKEMTALGLISRQTGQVVLGNFTCTVSALTRH